MSRAAANHGEHVAVPQAHRHGEVAEAACHNLVRKIGRRCDTGSHQEHQKADGGRKPLPRKSARCVNFFVLYQEVVLAVFSFAFSSIGTLASALDTGQPFFAASASS